MNTIKAITTLVKLAGVVGYFSDYLPAATALVVVAIASTVKDSLITIGDVLDDGSKNGSFKP